MEGQAGVLQQQQQLGRGVVVRRQGVRDLAAAAAARKARKGWCYLPQGSAGIEVGLVGW